MSLCDKCVANRNCGVKPGQLVVTCGAYKAPPTHGDGIRSMTDEELAPALYKLYLMAADRGQNFEDISTNWCDLKGGCEGREDRECTPELHQACILRWLKAEQGKKEAAGEQET